jgi:toluene monooxygenase electron transfer component
VNITVHARNGTHSFPCGPDDKILLAGLHSGLDLPYECTTGTCGTCKARVVSGRVESAWPEAPGTRYLKGEAEVLMCQGRAREDCTLEVARTLTAETPVPLRPRSFSGVLRSPRMLTHDVLAFEVDLDRPLDFEAGQFVILTVPGIAGARAYSMVNFDRQARRLSFVVKKKPGGAVSEWLFGASVEGTRLGLVGPLGHAVFQPDAGKHILCVAGGSGIAGMMSILSRAGQEAYFDAHAGDVFFGVRTARDVFFLDELEAFRAKSLERLNITVALSDEAVSDTLPRRYPSFAFAGGFVHTVAAEGMKGRFANVRAYAAGPPPMVDATLRWLLREVRLSPIDIRYDKFS